MPPTKRRQSTTAITTRISHQVLNTKTHSNLTHEIQEWKRARCITQPQKEEQAHLGKGLHLCRMLQHLVISLHPRHPVKQASMQENLETCLERRLLLFHHLKKRLRRRTITSMTHIDTMHQNMTIHSQPRTKHSLLSSSHRSQVQRITLTKHRHDPRVRLRLYLRKVHHIQCPCNRLKPIKVLHANRQTSREHQPRIEDLWRSPARQVSMVLWQQMLT